MSANPSDESAATAREAWALMSDLVLDNGRRRQLSEALGMSFGRTRALRRIANGSMSMRELADALGMDPPNVTVLVDELEALGLVRRQPHPTDRRAKVVVASRKGKTLARRADDILGTPPAGLTDLGERDLDRLRALLRKASGA